jgi:hypothetical protein
MKIILLFLISMVSIAGFTQQKISSNKWVDVTVTTGLKQGTLSAAYVHNWQVGKAGKFKLGLGGRFTAYTGTKKDFITSGPAKYTRSFTTPFLIFFAAQKEENFDTLQVQRPLTVSANISLNIAYQFTPKLLAGFNIDAIGFTLGRKTSGEFKGIKTGSTQGTFTDNSVKPVAFNLLLTGDHDKGSLNSEFFVAYQVAPRLSVKAVYQFIFIEYKTTSLKQKIPAGPSNNLFRNKANNFGVGVIYQLH